MKLVTKFVSVLSTITILSLFSGTSFVKADVFLKLFKIMPL